MTTWQRSSRSATAGSAQCPALRCPTACMACAVRPLAAGMTGPACASPVPPAVLRPPAIIVSPWTEPRTVSSTVFDHTSIIKTILLRFCPHALSERQPTRASRARLGPQYPGPACSPGQPSRGTPDPQHATTRPARRRAAAASGGQSCISRNQPAPARSAGTSRPPAQRPAKKHSCRDPRAAKAGTSTERALVSCRCLLSRLSCSGVLCLRRCQSVNAASVMSRRAECVTHCRCPVVVVRGRPGATGR